MLFDPTLPTQLLTRSVSAMWEGAAQSLALYGAVAEAAASAIAVPGTKPGKAKSKRPAQASRSASKSKSNEKPQGPRTRPEDMTTARWFIYDRADALDAALPKGTAAKSAEAKATSSTQSWYRAPGEVIPPARAEMKMKKRSERPAALSQAKRTAKSTDPVANWFEMFAPIPAERPKVVQKNGIAPWNFGFGNFGFGEVGFGDFGFGALGLDYFKAVGNPARKEASDPFALMSPGAGLAAFSLFQPTGPRWFKDAGRGRASISPLDPTAWWPAARAASRTAPDWFAPYRAPGAPAGLDKFSLDKFPLDIFPRAYVNFIPSVEMPFTGAKSWGLALIALAIPPYLSEVFSLFFPSAMVG